MPNITYVTRKAHMGYEQVMKLPYPIFVSYLVENKIMDLQETEEGREYLRKIERLKVTTPDYSKLKSTSGYKQKAGESNARS
ncbi:hypothetical protein [Radiobacillus sp. PE A8.2]|uniref:hypothetical protein n=1 Tax=Radiobacillus sp. PE A8.2 TaxID=3380349 RepID=UPI00388E012B